jgi:hypothetical protein
MSTKIGVVGAEGRFEVEIWASRGGVEMHEGRAAPLVLGALIGRRCWDLAEARAFAAMIIAATEEVERMRKADR